MNAVCVSIIAVLSVDDSCLVNCFALSSSLLALIACVAATQFPFPLLRKPLCYITLILSVFGWFQIGKINNKHTFSCQELISTCANCLTGNWNSFTYLESYKPSVSCLSWEACYIFIICYCLGCLNNIIPYKIVYYYHLALITLYRLI